MRKTATTFFCLNQRAIEAKACCCLLSLLLLLLLFRDTHPTLQLHTLWHATHTRSGRLIVAQWLRRWVISQRKQAIAYTVHTKYTHAHICITAHTYIFISTFVRNYLYCFLYFSRLRHLWQLRSECIISCLISLHKQQKKDKTKLATHSWSRTACVACRPVAHTHRRSFCLHATWLRIDDLMRFCWQMRVDMAPTSGWNLKIYEQRNQVLDENCKKQLIIYQMLQICTHTCRCTYTRMYVCTRYKTMRRW